MNEYFSRLLQVVALLKISMEHARNVKMRNKIAGAQNKSLLCLSLSLSLYLSLFLSIYISLVHKQNNHTDDRKLYIALSLLFLSLRQARSAACPVLPPDDVSWTNFAHFYRFCTVSMFKLYVPQFVWLFICFMKKRTPW